MTQEVRMAATDIRNARNENPGMRERDLATKLGISEGELVAAYCGESVTRISPEVNDILPVLKDLGEVMALTRNESAVHEKIGVYDNVHTGPHNAMVLAGDIDLRIFPSNWAHGFAVEKQGDGEIRRSLQFFDFAGDAIHKIHLRPASDINEYQKLVGRFRLEDQSPAIAVSEKAPSADLPAMPANHQNPAIRDELRKRWQAMTDVHQFFGILKSLGLSRLEAFDLVGDEFAWQIDCDAVAALMHHASEDGMPIMCFVGNHGCIQIHSGPVKNIKIMGPWINVMDPSFHLHLRLDQIENVWAVRKPNSDGHVTSVEAYDADNRMIIQFFGKRHEGRSERQDWRALAEAMPRIPTSTAA